LTTLPEQRGPRDTQSQDGGRENEYEGHCSWPHQQGIPTARGGEWSSVQVMRILERLDRFREEEAAAA